jgi:Flp pilus assembly protein TadB
MTLTRLCYNPRSAKRLKRALQKIAKEKEKDSERGNREGGKSPTEINVEGKEEEQATSSGLQPSRMQLYAWQIPVVLLAVAVLKLVIGLNIWVFEAAVAEPTWGDDKKVWNSIS